MTPVSTALPGPQIEVLDSYLFAVHEITAAPGTSSVYQIHWKARNQMTPTGFEGWLYGGVGGVGSTTEVAGATAGAPGNVFCTLVITTVNSVGGGFSPTYTRPAYGPSGAWGSGSLQAPASVVSSYSVMFATTDALDNWPIDTTGFCFVPFPGGAPAANFVDSLRTGSAPLNGMGVFFNPDGAGGLQVDYMAWNIGAAVERITIPSSVIPDVTNWNTLRFVIVSAGSGRDATMSLAVNESSIVTDRLFGSAALPFMDAVNADALLYAFGISGGPGGGAGYFYRNYGYDGRFTPSGSELQPFGA